MFQVYLLPYYFILMLFLAYDYFRELPNAGLLDVARAGEGCVRSDVAQFFVMQQWIFASAFMFGGTMIFGFYLSDNVTKAVFFYICKFTFLYIVLNGTVAVMLAWLLSRTVGNLLGYVCVVLFACASSPMMTSEISYLSMLFRSLYDVYRVFLIMPEEESTYCPGTLLAINMSVASRTLFWLFLFSAGLLLTGRNRHRKQGAVVLVAAAACCFIYTYLPASYYSDNGSYTSTNSTIYDDMTYMIDESVTQQEASGFSVSAYEIQLRIRRQLDATVSLFPEDGSLPEYKMTLYHLYEVEAVTDEDGNALSYARAGDYLTVYSPDSEIEGICIKYSGALANFYTNSENMFLPGCFPYYPVPGFRTIYQNYEYVNNYLDEKVQFDVIVDTPAIVYSDLEQIERNHFCGESYGVTLISGFIAETTYENGIRCIYPYLDKGTNAVSEVSKEEREYVLSYLEDYWSDMEGGTVIFLPVYLDIRVEQENTVIANSWKILQSDLERTGRLMGEEADEIMAMDEMVGMLYTYYNLMCEDAPELITYESMKEEWDGLRADNELDISTEEAFETMLREYFGQDIYEQVMESKPDSDEEE